MVVGIVLPLLMQPIIWLLPLLLLLVFGKKLKKWRYLLLGWAISIGFAQIYVGVHYPLDVLAGFSIGGLIAFFSHYLYQRFSFSCQLIVFQFVFFSDNFVHFNKCLLFWSKYYRILRSAWQSVVPNFGLIIL